MGHKRAISLAASWSYYITGALGGQLWIGEYAVSARHDCKRRSPLGPPTRAPTLATNDFNRRPPRTTDPGQRCAVANDRLIGEPEPTADPLPIADVMRAGTTQAGPCSACRTGGKLLTASEGVTEKGICRWK